MNDYVERSVIERLLAIAAVGDSEENRRTWARAMCIAHITPAADVAPVVHGQWKLVYRQADGGEYKCSECARKYVFNSFNHSSNYCPNCGAKMDGGEDLATD